MQGTNRVCTAGKPPCLGCHSQLHCQISQWPSHFSGGGSKPSVERRSQHRRAECCRSPAAAQSHYSPAWHCHNTAAGDRCAFPFGASTPRRAFVSELFGGTHPRRRRRPSTVGWEVDPQRDGQAILIESGVYSGCSSVDRQSHPA